MHPVKASNSVDVRSLMNDSGRRSEEDRIAHVTMLTEEDEPNGYPANRMIPGLTIAVVHETGHRNPRKETNREEPDARDQVEEEIHLSEIG